MEWLTQSLYPRLKPYLRWLVMGVVGFFLLQTLSSHWSEVLTLQLEGGSGLKLAIALVLTLLAHIWSGWVWGWILQTLQYPVTAQWSIRVYLLTNLAKYLPGNVWHFYGRVVAAQRQNVPLAIATLSVLLEPLLMVAAALLLTLLLRPNLYLALQLPILIGVLIAIHPRFLNPLLRAASQIKGRLKGLPQAGYSLPTITHYPLKPLAGELIFLLLRGSGFVLTLLVFQSLTPNQLPLLLSSFCLAWLLGLVIPGAPGGIGIFEATILSLLQPQWSPSVILATVAVYRLIATLAETLGAFLAWLSQKRFSF
ncbi:flippase-like domain-containing protein [Spirulina subsalsa FACHB-351]|uniref:Flippase-like domain-containing protein n=1 Tax=Spirulina subsalsa FACHB-351 TaxID=234711 RepID=A0ABT3L046_9CYAN|nr:flippase-like domain-containing protein [Spirulina subsalsa]MCW6034874.1 flippase-like domain-containing protein [Spirulina subsalsa FACHB-351]